MASFASDLKAEREKRSVTLAQIAADTNISLRHLQSLEEGRYGDLPGGIYNRAFIRAYCDCLHIDSKEMLNRYQSELSPAVEKTPRTRKSIPQQNRLAKYYPVFAWSLMLLISATGLFFSRNWIASIFSPFFSRTPSPAVRYEPAAKPAPPPPSESAPAQEPAAVNGMETPADTVSASAVAQDVPPTASAPASPSPELRLEIEVLQECWISIDADGQPAFSRLLKAGDVQSLGASEYFAITAGNAGGLRLKINGKAAKPLGKPGEVVRVRIDRTTLQQWIDETLG